MIAQPTERDRERARELRQKLLSEHAHASFKRRFDEEIAQALADARAEERERCARLIAKPPAGGWRSWEAAAAIRNQDLANG